MNVTRIAPDNALLGRSLAEDVLNAAARDPGAPGLISDRTMFSYGDIAGLAVSWAAAIRSEFSPHRAFQIVAIIAPSSPVAYIGSLAVQIAGGIFVPIDPALPIEVINSRLRDISPSCIALDARCNGILPKLNVQGAPVLTWDEHCPGPSGQLQPQPYRPASLVYILSTSGSTGPAKLTPIRAVGARQAVAQVRAKIGLGAGDRLIQTFPVGFDLSILATYLAWTSGAALLLPQRPDQAEDILLTGSAESCTVWFSVPSLIRIMLEGASLPSVRHSLFCGEALYASDVAKWRGIARNTAVHNLYGPTECAMVATHYECPDTPGSGVVPIGWPLPGVAAEVAAIPDSGGPGNDGPGNGRTGNGGPGNGEPGNGRTGNGGSGNGGPGNGGSGNGRPGSGRIGNGRTANGGPGELLLGGRQMMPGYWRRPEETRKSMVIWPDQRRRMYRTGDLVRRDADGLLHFIGRADDQVKVMGHRIELQEVAMAVSGIDGVSEAVAFTVTDDATSCERLVAVYTSKTGVNPAQVRKLLMSRLPQWMVPWPIIQARALPRNGSGKTSAEMLRRQFMSGGIS